MMSNAQIKLQNLSFTRSIRLQQLLSRSQMNNISSILTRENCSKVIEYLAIKMKSVSVAVYANTGKLYIYCREEIYPFVLERLLTVWENYKQLCEKYLNIKPIYLTAGIISLAFFFLFSRFISRKNDQNMPEHTKQADEEFIFDEEGSTAANNAKSDESLFSLKKPMDAILQASNQSQQDSKSIKQDRIFFQVFQNYRSTLDASMGVNHYVRN